MMMKFDSLRLGMVDTMASAMLVRSGPAEFTSFQRQQE